MVTGCLNSSQSLSLDPCETSSSQVPILKFDSAYFDTYRALLPKTRISAHGVLFKGKVKPPLPADTQQHPASIVACKGTDIAS